MPTATDTLNPTAASLLGLLHHGPMTGWELVSSAQTAIGPFWSLTRSQVYRELSAMTAAGLLEAGPRGRRDARPYALTADGRAAFAAWLERGPDAETIRFPLLLTVLFGRHLPPGRLAEVLAGQRAEHAERLAGYEAADADADPYARAVLDFGRRYERAVLEWFDGLPGALTAR
ncbi:MAG: PadR family transcriptional regulator [Pseudonocardia sp.]